MEDLNKTMTTNKNLDIKKAQKGLIDSRGRRKYFRELNPVLLKDPFQFR